jgi:hypothetical protein
MAKPDKLECLAYLPPIQTAITISGDGDLMQAKFNINLSVSPDAARLLIMTGKKLKLTVETLTDFDERAKKDHATEKETEGTRSKANRRRITDRRNQ